jgi:DNA-directed RNA polymerase specialized sigma24 family protein
MDEIVDKPSFRKKEWILTQTALDKLLAWLDPDRERAGVKLENIRRKVMKFFECQGCLSPEEYTDATIDRVAKTIDQSVEIRTSEPSLFFHGVARNVLKEYWRKPERKWATFETLLPSQHPGEDPNELEAQALKNQTGEQRYHCLQCCAQELPTVYRELIVQYYYATGRTKIENRERLAGEMKVTVNALRIRAHRIRAELETCVEKCLKRP